MGPHRQTDRLTLNEMKKVQSGHTDPSDDNHKEIIIEDCQVPVDNMSYADWLLEQGIDTNLDAQEILGTDIKEPAQSSEDFGNVQPTQEQPASVVPIPNSTDDKQRFDPQPLVQEYLSKFQKDLNLYIISSQSQEDTVERINRVINALHNMGVDPKMLALSLKNKMDENKDIHKKDDDGQDNGLVGVTKKLLKK